MVNAVHSFRVRSLQVLFSRIRLRIETRYWWRTEDCPGTYEPHCRS
jgi:hypothetical protein